jgi:hypothetical protein
MILNSLVLAANMGCGSGQGQPAQVVPVKGKVTFKGQPLTKGVIKFRPVDLGREASGTIQSDGTFVLSTYKEGDGAAIGRNQVSIKGTGTGSKEVIPKKYLTFITSKLEAEVSPENTEFTFDLN